MAGPSSDLSRSSRYASVLDILSAFPSFTKAEIYPALKNENRPFIGRIIHRLIEEDYLIETGTRSRLLYSWTEKGKALNKTLWIDQQVFTPAMKRSPTEDRPRERLLRLGAPDLKTSELLAILVRAGLPGESAIQAGEKLAALFGDNLKGLSFKTKSELKQISRAIGETAYCQIMAALELGKRYLTQEQGPSEKPVKITSAAAALNFCRTRFNRLAQEGAQEEFHIVLLNQAHQVLKTKRITVGLSNKSLVHPQEVFRPAVQESASSVILVHNHPGGDPTPSPEDIRITRELRAAADILGINVLDHIILAKDGIVSLKEEKIF